MVFRVVFICICLGFSVSNKRRCTLSKGNLTKGDQPKENYFIHQNVKLIRNVTSFHQRVSATPEDSHICQDFLVKSERSNSNIQSTYTNHKASRRQCNTSHQWGSCFDQREGSCRRVPKRCAVSHDYSCGCERFLPSGHSHRQGLGLK